MKNLTFIRFCLGAVMFTLFPTSSVWGAKLCQSGYTGTIGALGSKTVSVSIGTIGTNTYRVVFESDFAMTGSLSYLVISGNDNFCLNSATKRIFDGGHKIFFDISSTSAPTFKNDIQVQTSEGNWTLTGTAVNTIDWSQTTGECSALESPAGGTGKLYWVKPQGWNWTTPLYAYMWNGGTNNTWPGVTISTDEQVTLDYGDADIYEWDYSSPYNKLKLHDKDDANNMDGLDIYGENMYYVPTIMSNATTVTNWKWCASQDMNLQIGNAADNYYNNDASHKFAFSAGLGNTLTRTVTLAANTVYYFKLAQTQDNNWYTNSAASATAGVGQMSSSDCTDWNMAYNGYDDKPTKLLTTEPGEYTFVYDYTRDRLSVIYPNQMHASTACSGISNEIIEGSDFYYGYDFSTLGNGDVQIQFEWLGDGEPANIYFHDWTSGGLVETSMTRSGKVGTKTMSGKSAGDIIIFGCKFDKSGVYRTRKFVYKVGYDCSVAECSESGNIAAGKLTKAGYSRMYTSGKGGRNDNEQPQNAVDGKTTTHFIAWGADNAAEDAYRWWAVDLGAEYNLSNIKIYWQEAGRASSNYVLQTRSDLSDDFANDAPYSNTGWTTIKTVTETQVIGSANSYDVIGTGRYVRLVSTDRKNLAISEFEVYVTGCPSDDSNPPTMTAATYVSNNVGNTGAIVELTATDLEGDVSRFRLDKVGGGTTYVNTDGSHHATLDGLSSGSHTYHVYAIDGGGNVSANYVPLIFCFFNPAENLALNKTAVSGRSRTVADVNAAETPDKAVDGYGGSGPGIASRPGGGISEHRQFGMTAGDFPNKAWWTVDLGAKYQLANVDIYWTPDANQAPQSYIIQVATETPTDFVNDASRQNLVWETVKTVTNTVQNIGEGSANKNRHSFTVGDDVVARYVRIINLDAVRIAMYIREVEIYAHAINCDDDAPTMVSADLVSKNGGNTGVIVELHGDDEVSDDAITKFKLVEMDGVTPREAIYLTTDAQNKAEIDGLTTGTYTYQVYAVDEDGNVSANYVTLTFCFIDPTENLALNKSVTYGHQTGAAPASAAVNGNNTDRWGSQGRASIDDDWIQVDLGEAFYIDHIKIQWEQARPAQYQILLSLDGTNWRIWQYNTAPAWADPASSIVYETYNMSGVAARYVKIKSLVDVSNEWGISIWELEIYGTGICYVSNSSAPTMDSATEYSKTSNTAVVSVSATDDETSPVVTYIVDGLVYTASEGRLTFSNLSACQTYTWRIYAMDEHENISANYKEVTMQINPPASGTNLALGKPVYSGYDEGGDPKTAAVDGDRTTRWATNGRASAADEWLVIDLEGMFKIDSIQVEWEYGTSINYEFRIAYDATFGPSDGYSGAFNKILTGNFATFEHKNEPPVGGLAANMERNEKTHQTADHIIDHYYYNAADQYVTGRYLQVKSMLEANYPSSLWEIRVYGVCVEETDCPTMEWAEVVTTTDVSAEVYVSALDKQTSAANMKYEAVVTSGEPGQFQLTSTYSFTPANFVDGRPGYLNIGGLLPDVPYSIDIYAIDESDCKSTNYKHIEFTTAALAGCTYTNTQAYRVGEIGNASTRIFQKGYRVSITDDGDNFTIVAYTYDDFYELTSPVIQIATNPANLPGSGVDQYTTSQVLDENSDPVARTFSYTFAKSAFTGSPFNGEITFFVKFPFSDGGICLTQPITYDITEGCHPEFIIYHHDDKPTAAARTSYEGGTIPYQIAYYRHFTAGVWEDITLPFTVSDIQVYDPEDHQYYSIRATYGEGGSKVVNEFLLRIQQDHVSGAGFVEGWQNGNSALPIKDQPYAIRFTHDYYLTKYIIFRGEKNQTIDSELDTPENVPTEKDQYQVYGNNTMKACPVSGGKAYLLPADHSDETYRLVESSAQVRPFETYVLANSETMRVMKMVAPWRGNTTSLDDVRETLTEHPYVAVYTIDGKCVGTWKNISIQDVTDNCASYLPAGCYVIHAGQQTAKIVLK